MPAILEALRLKPKPVELKIVYKSWSKAPRFQGKLKKDGPVDDWLGKIKAGCIEHGIPREQWHVVAQHYMGKKALKRFREMDRVMQIMHNGKYTWNWKKYKIAMRNMGWDINAKETKSLTVERKSGLWTVVDGLLHPQSQPNSPAPPKRSSSSSFMSRINSQSDDVPTMIAKVPRWLVNAAQSLADSADEHQELLMVVGSILIVAGRVPALVSALGVGGGVLDGPVAQGVGDALIELGRRLQTKPVEGKKDD